MPRSLPSPDSVPIGSSRCAIGVEVICHGMSGTSEVPPIVADRVAVPVKLSASSGSHGRTKSGIEVSAAVIASPSCPDSQAMRASPLTSTPCVVRVKADTSAASVSSTRSAVAAAAPTVGNVSEVDRPGRPGCVIERAAELEAGLHRPTDALERRRHVDARLPGRAHGPPDVGDLPPGGR